MAEVNIMSVAQDFNINKYTPVPWICRDDNDDYWTVIRDTSNQLRVYKSIDSGATWVLKKTLTNSDWTGDPFPTDAFQIINLSGADKVYLFIVDSSYKLYGWIFNVTADTNQVDMDNISADSSSYEAHASWDDSNNRLLVYWARTHIQGEGRFGKINLDTTFTYAGYDYLNTGAGTNGRPLSYYIDSGYGYQLGESLTIDQMILKKMDNHATLYNLSIDYVNIGVVRTDLLFANVITNSDGNPVVGWVDANSGSPKFEFTIRDKTNLATVISTSSQLIASGVNPESCYMAIDGNNNLYFVYTDGIDKECYSVKYDGSWSSAMKISSDNDGQLAMPEIKAPITDNKILVTYQATS